MSDSSPSAHALDYVEKTIAGEPVKFGKLSVRDRAQLLESAKKSAKEELGKSLIDAGLEKDQKYVELRTHDTEKWGLHRWAELANSYDGQHAIYVAALKRQNYSESQIDKILSSLALPQQEEMELICELAHLPLMAPSPMGTRQIGTLNGQPIYAAVPKEGGDEANPTEAGNPPSYGT